MKVPLQEWGLSNRLSALDIKEVEDDRLISAEGPAAANMGEQGIGDLASSAGDANTHRSLRHCGGGCGGAGRRMRLVLLWGD
eukprot:2531621-Rhodomonas_salina.2